MQDKQYASLVDASKKTAFQRFAAEALAAAWEGESHAETIENIKSLLNEGNTKKIDDRAFWAQLFDILQRVVKVTSAKFQALHEGTLSAASAKLDQVVTHMHTTFEAQYKAALQAVVTRLVEAREPKPFSATADGDTIVENNDQHNIADIKQLLKVTKETLRWSDGCNLRRLATPEKCTEWDAASTSRARFIDCIQAMAPLAFTSTINGATMPDDETIGKFFSHFAIENFDKHIIPAEEASWQRFTNHISDGVDHAVREAAQALDVRPEFVEAGCKAIKAKDSKKGSINCDEIAFHTFPKACSELESLATRFRIMNYHPDHMSKLVSADAFVCSASLCYFATSLTRVRKFTSKLAVGNTVKDLSNVFHVASAVDDAAQALDRSVRSLTEEANSTKETLTNLQSELLEQKSDVVAKLVDAVLTPQENLASELQNVLKVLNLKEELTKVVMGAPDNPTAWEEPLLKIARSKNAVASVTAITTYDNGFGVLRKSIGDYGGGLDIFMQDNPCYNPCMPARATVQV